MDADDPLIQAMLDQAWMEAEKRIPEFLTIGVGDRNMDDPIVREYCLKACSLVGLEAEQRKLRREAELKNQERDDDK